MDCARKTHEFHVRTRLQGHIVVLDAFELRYEYPSGYQCEMVDDPEDDLLGLLERLRGKLRSMISVKHLTAVEAEPQIASPGRYRGKSIGRIRLRTAHRSF